MKRTHTRALRYSLGAVLTMSLFAACSGDDPGTPDPFNGEPAVLDISAISLGQGNVLAGGSSVLSCDNKIAVALNVQAWRLRPPGVCDVAECGRVSIQLSDPSGYIWLSQQTSSVGVTLDVSSFRGELADPPLTSGTYTVSAELLDDSGAPHNPGDGGKGAAEQTFQLDLPASCPVSGDATAGAGGASDGGAGSVAEGGAAGLGGSAGAVSVSGGSSGSGVGGGSSGSTAGGGSGGSTAGGGSGGSTAGGGSGGSGGLSLTAGTAGV